MWFRLYVRGAVRGGTGNDGLLQRIQVFVWPDVSKEWCNVDEWPDTEAKNEAFAVFEYLDNLTPEQVGADSSDGIPSCVLPMMPRSFLIRGVPGWKRNFAAVLSIRLLKRTWQVPETGSRSRVADSSGGPKDWPGFALRARDGVGVGRVS